MKRRTYLGITICLLGFLAMAQAQNVPTGFQEYYVTGSEQHIWNMMFSVAGAEGFGTCSFNPTQMASVVAVTASSNNQIIYYDQWEDQYEQNILTPAQGSTLVLGDNNPANGDARNFSNDPRIGAGGINCDCLLRGTNLKFNSDQNAGPSDHLGVPVSPRVASDVRYDGADHLMSTGGPVTLVHFQQPLGCNFIGSSVEVLSLQAVGNAYSYSVPVGTNTYTRYGGDGTPGSPFKYVWLDLVAFSDNTQVFIDNKNGGTASFTLNKGQHYSSQGDIDGTAATSVIVREGTKISTSKPITGIVYTAGSGTYQDRPFTLMPDLMHSTDFMITAPGDNPGVNGSQPLNLYIYNPGTSAINVTATDSTGTGTFNVPANSVKAFTEATAMNRAIASNSTVRLTSASNFWGFSAYDYTETTVDWGHSWLATKFLTPFYSLSYAPGVDFPATRYSTRGTRGCNGVAACDSENRSPIFVSALQDNTRIQVDLNNDGVYDRIDTNSDDVPEAPTDPSTNTYVINALQTLRVFDQTDYDNTGTQIIANKPVAVAYGQDSDQGVPSDHSLDLGNSVWPLDQRWLDSVLTVNKTANPQYVPLGGGNVTYTLTVKSYNFGPLSSLAVYDFLPAGGTYQAGSTVITYPDTTQSFLDPVITGNKLDWTTKLNSNSLFLNQPLTVQYTVSYATSASPKTLRNQAHADATLGGSVFSAQGYSDVVQTAISLSMTVDKATAQVGQTLLYTITVTNSGSTETNAVISDPIPDGTTFTGSITPGGPFIGAFKSAQNAVVWTAASFPPGTATVSFVVTVNSDVTGAASITDQSFYESTQTPNFASNAVTTLLGPKLSFLKSGPSVAAPGDILTYAITVSNTGSGPANSVLAYDTYPANSTYVSGTLEMKTNNGPYTSLTDATDGVDAGYAFADHAEFRLASLAINTTVTFRFKVLTANNVSGFINNFATVSCTEFAAKDTNLVQTFIQNSGSITPPPFVNGPIFAGATSISGTSSSPNGTVIRVYRNGVQIGTAIVTNNGWSLSSIGPLSAGDVMTADAKETGKTTSNLSGPVIVSALATPAPVVNSPIIGGSTSVSGTSTSPDGTLIDVYVNGVYVGETTVSSGVWTLTNLSPLVGGQLITATATQSGKGTSALSNTVTVTDLGTVLSGPSVGAPGDILTYSAQVTSTISPSVANFVLIDNIPANTTYVASSMEYKIDGGPYVPLTDNNGGDDPGYLFAGPNRVELHLPSISANVSVTFRFKVSVNAIATPATLTDVASYSSSLTASRNTNTVNTTITAAGLITPPPEVTGPIFAGATTVTGTSTSPDGTSIRVYRNGVLIGTVTVTGGLWTLNIAGQPLSAGESLTADATEAGKSTSNLSPAVIVSPLGQSTTPPTVLGPLYSGDTTVSGNSSSPDGATIDVYANGVFLGQTTVFNGFWTISNTRPLVTGQVVNATATEPGKGTSGLSNNVTVQALPAFLKRDTAGDLVAGETLSYTIEVHNTSAVNWNNITVTDTIPSGTSYIAGSSQITAPATVSTPNTYLDQFTNVAYNGSNGTINWASSPWAEFGDDSNPATGEVTVRADLGDNSVRIQNTNRGIRRLANLTGYVTATLTFEYRRNAFDDVNDSVSIQASSNGGTSWTTLATYAGPTNDAAYQSASFDITSYIASNTAVQFISSGNLGSGDNFFIDNVQIAVSSNSRVMQTTAGCAPSTLVGAAGCNGFTLFPNETMFVTFQVTVDNPLSSGITLINNTASFTNGQGNIGSFSVTNGISGIPNMMRNDLTTTIASYNPATIFKHYPRRPSLEGFGTDGIAQEGEGGMLGSNGSSDDDDFYKRAVPNTWLDPDTTVLNDPTRPLVFYELSCSTCILHLTKSGTQIQSTY